MMRIAVTGSMGQVATGAAEFDAFARVVRNDREPQVTATVKTPAPRRRAPRRPLLPQSPNEGRHLGAAKSVTSRGRLVVPSTQDASTTFTGQNSPSTTVQTSTVA
jgi:hypothetical protein